MPLSLDEILERTQWDFFWVPPDAHVIDRPELAFIACPRDVTYLNTVTRTRALSPALPSLIDEVSRTHDGVTSRWLVPSTYDTGALEKALASTGYKPIWEHDTYAIDVEAYQARDSPGISVHAVSSMPRLSECIDVTARAFDEIRDDDLESRQNALKQCLAPDTRVHRFVAYDDTSARPISSGGLTLFPSLRFGFLWAGGTVPEARGRGGYAALLAARIARARQLGMEYVGLYARVHSSAQIVSRAGFQRVGRMEYWDRPP